VASYKSSGKKTSPLGEPDCGIFHGNEAITLERTDQFFEVRIVRIQPEALQFKIAFFLEVPEEFKRLIYPFFIHPPS
jgi:cystathionine beta-lyase/cystathionine gamma-synthase